MYVRSLQARSLLTAALLVLSLATAVQAAPPGQATLVSATGSSVFTFTWNRVNTSTWYFLWVNDPTSIEASLGTYANWFTAAQAGCAGAELTCTVTIPLNLYHGTGTFYVQTFNNTDGYGPWSAGLNFTILPRSSPGTIVDANGNLVGTLIERGIGARMINGNFTTFHFSDAGPSMINTAVYYATIDCTGQGYAPALTPRHLESSGTLATSFIRGGSSAVRTLLSFIGYNNGVAGACSATNFDQLTSLMVAYDATSDFAGLTPPYSVVIR